MTPDFIRISKTRSGPWLIQLRTVDVEILPCSYVATRSPERISRSGFSDPFAIKTRAGGATEADHAGADVELIREGLTQTNTNTTLRYIRRRSAKLDKLADVRKAARNADTSDGTA
jgi:hypothetical protein